MWYKSAPCIPCTMTLGLFDRALGSLWNDSFAVLSAGKKLLPPPLDSHAQMLGSAGTMPVKPQPTKPNTRPLQWVQLLQQARQNTRQQGQHAADTTGYKALHQVAAAGAAHAASPPPGTWQPEHLAGDQSLQSPTPSYCSGRRCSSWSVSATSSSLRSSARGTPAPTHQVPCSCQAVSKNLVTPGTDAQGLMIK